MGITNNWQIFLRQELQARQRRNPNYSLRSFAKQLQISPTQLSMVLSGKRTLKPKLALHLSEVLGLTTFEMIALLDQDQSLMKKGEFANFQTLDVDEFGPIANWQYFAILGLAHLSANVADPKWIAKKLNLPLAQMKQCFEDLIRTGQLEVKNGQFRQATPPLRTADDVPAVAVRRYHKQCLQVAAQKIEEVSVELREYSSFTLAISPKKMKAAKKMLREFKEGFAEEMSKGKPTAVYNFCMQFYPLTDTSTS